MFEIRTRWVSTLVHACVAVFCALSGEIEAADSLGVIPTPQQVDWRGGAFLVDETTPVVLSPRANEAERFAARELVHLLRDELNLTLNVGSSAGPDAPPGSIVIGNPETNPHVAARMKAYGLALSDRMHDEGYVLGVGPDGIVIGASSGAGVLYGAMTLEQMLLARGAGQPLAGVRIHDWPHMKMRGVQDEISYGQVSTMQNFKEIIRFHARFKMNTYYIYLEDTFRFEKYPTIGVGRGALTRQQVDELEEFAKPYHVEIIPIFEMLGNQGALLMLDEVRPYAEYPGAHSFSISEPSFEFLQNCFQELIAAFDSEYFHAGLDESWDLGFGKTEELVNREGRGPVHAAHYRRINDLFQQNGKTMMMYADIILNRPEILELIPKNIILMDWHYDPAESYPSVAQIAEKGFPLVVLPGMNNWDRIFPTMSNAMINIRNFTLDGVRHNAVGSVTSTWGDNGSKNLRELLYYGYAYGAEVSWTPQTTDIGSYSERFFTLWNGPGTAPHFQAAYALLEKWPWWYPLLDYFRHPFLPRKDERPHTERELYRVGEDARVAGELVEVLRPLVRRRPGDLDYLSYCARSHQHYVKSQLLVRDLQSFDAAEATPEQIEQARSRFLDEIDRVRSETLVLRDMFRELWLRTNLEANLHYAIDEYNALVKVWDDAAERVARGTFAYDPRPGAEWIYHAGGIDGKREVQHAYFRKSFDVNPDAESFTRAGMQLHGDTHIKVYVNGQLLGEQFARRNLSCPVNPQLLRVYDILPYLKKGRNVIAVEAHNYGTENANLDPGGPARCGGFHFYAELLGKDGSVDRLVSDESWKVSDQPGDEWNSVELDDSSWPTAKPDPEPTVWITYPDFERGLRGFSNRR